MARSRLDRTNFEVALAEVCYCAGQGVSHEKKGEERDIYGTLPNKERHRYPINWTLSTKGIRRRHLCELYLTTVQDRWVEAPPEIGEEVLAQLLVEKGYTVERTRVKKGNWHSGIKFTISYTILVPASVCRYQ